MSERVDWQELRSWAITCKVVGVEPPAPAVKALHLLSVAESTIPDPTGPLLGLSDAKIRERVEQLSIRTHHDYAVGNAGMRPGVRAVSDALAVEVLEACASDLDRLVGEKQDEFATLAEPLMRGAQEYGFSLQTSSDDVVDLADESASEAWRGVRRAWQSIAVVVRWRIELAKVFRHDQALRDASTDQDIRHGIRPPNFSPLFAAGPGSVDAGYYVEGKTVGSIDWLALAAGGLRLNTPSEVDEKLQGRGLKRATPAHVVDPGDDEELDVLKYTYR